MELVDSPRDLRWELTSRGIGWEILKDKLKLEGKRPEAIINAGAQQTLDVMRVEKDMQFNERGYTPTENTMGTSEGPEI